jgi:hypothetical protein
MLATSQAEMNRPSSRRICITGAIVDRPLSFALPTPLRALKHARGPTCPKLIAMNSAFVATTVGRRICCKGLERSEEFETAIQPCFPKAGSSSLRPLSKTNWLQPLARSIEHALVLRRTFAELAPNSGAAVLRLQYEALLRAAWLLFSATPSPVERLSRTLDLEAEQAAKSLPGRAQRPPTVSASSTLPGAPP